MRTRAESLGGTLDAGPRPHGGWRVHARLPATPPPTGRPRSSRWSSRLALDAGLFVLTLVLPAAAVVIAVQEENLAPTPAALILLAVLAHTAPLLWRRRHPWTVLAAVALTTWLAPVLLTTTGTVWPFLLSAGADLAAVHAVAARGARPTLTWLAPFAATASTAYALGVLAALDPPTGIDPVPTGPWLTAFLIAVMAVLTGLVLAVPFGATWLAGHTARRRRDRRLAHEQAALAAVTTQTEIRTRAERARIAAGLHESVLEHTAAVPRAAEAADLPGVLGAARAALGEMRSLLDDLDTPAPSAPTPRATHTGKAAPGVQPVGPEGSPS